jgi:hypothetical protein
MLFYNSFKQATISSSLPVRRSAPIAKDDSDRAGYGGDRQGIGHTTQNFIQLLPCTSSPLGDDIHIEIYDIIPAIFVNCALIK